MYYHLRKICIAVHTCQCIFLNSTVEYSLALVFQTAFYVSTLSFNDKHRHLSLLSLQTYSLLSHWVWLGCSTQSISASSPREGFLSISSSTSRLMLVCLSKGYVTQSQVLLSCSRREILALSGGEKKENRKPWSWGRKSRYRPWSRGSKEISNEESWKSGEKSTQ